MCSMANYRNNRNLKRGLGKLDQKEKDYMENLANSLLKLQNDNFDKKSSISKDKPDDILISNNQQDIIDG